MFPCTRMNIFPVQNAMTYICGRAAKIPQRSRYLYVVCEEIDSSVYVKVFLIYISWGVGGNC